MNRSYHHGVKLNSARLAGSLMLAFLVTGCSTGVLNANLSERSSQSRYDFESRLPENDDRLFVVLAFSGGSYTAA
jgi:NTE family protein